MFKIQKFLKATSESLKKNSDLLEPENALVVMETTHGIEYEINGFNVTLDFTNVKVDSEMSGYVQSLTLELATWELAKSS